MGSETRSPKLRVNLVWMILGTAIYAASVWAVLVMLAKLGTPETVGYYTLGLAYTTPVVAFFGLNLRVVQATDARNEFSFATYAGQRVVATVLAWLCIAQIPAHPPLFGTILTWCFLARCKPRASKPKPRKKK